MHASSAALLVLACAAGAAAFAPSTPALTGLKQTAFCQGPKLSAACRAPRAAKTTTPSMSLMETANQAVLLAEGGMNVSVAAYLAVLLGTFIPVVFLITLFIQSEARKAAESGQE